MDSPLVFIVDDEPSARQILELQVSAGWGFTARGFSDAESCLAALDDDPDLILLDISLPGMSGDRALVKIKERSPDVPVIMLSAQESVDVAVHALKLGAHDYFTKPPDIPRFESSVRTAIQMRKLSREIRHLRETLEQPAQFESIVTQDGLMHDVLRLVQRARDSNIAVLVQGESGTGKELVARAIHFSGKRKNGPFVIVNCASIPRDLLESEMFGHERGAFTGATQLKIGKFELAHAGTIVFDEIGEMDIGLQAKLLRAIQTREFSRVGGNDTIKVDVRIISATNRDLMKSVADNVFREDLFYRISSFPIVVPPLRQRRSDILLLAETFLRRNTAVQGKNIRTFSHKAMQLMYQYRWPGNVRELENALERAVLLAEGDMITEEDLPLTVQAFGTGEHHADAVSRPTDSTAPIVPLETVRENAIRHALKVTEGNILEAARQLGLGRATLYRLMKKYKIVAGE